MCRLDVLHCKMYGTLLGRRSNRFYALWHRKASYGSTVRKFSPNPSKKTIKNSMYQNKRINTFGIQMLSDYMHKQVFKKQDNSSQNEVIVEKCMKQLRDHGINFTKPDVQEEINFKLPELLGDDILEHFRIIGEQQGGLYKQLAYDLLTKMPSPPKKWVFQQGWTRYVEGKEPEIVPYPKEKSIVFDVEVCMSCGKAPTLATAVSNEAWYGWISRSLIEGSSQTVSLDHYDLDLLIPMESLEQENQNNEYTKEPKLVVGHNVSYDRARVKEQYWLDKTGTRFIDTMSLHICVSGITSYQRIMLKTKKTENMDDDLASNSSLNNLADVYNLYCGGNLEKKTRDLFVDGNLQDIRNNFQEVMNYCANDVNATYSVLKELFPLFLERFPHPVSFAGMLELGTAYLPLNENWNKYIENCEEAYEDLNIEGKLSLGRRADQACYLFHNDKYKEDLWMWDQDWDVKNVKMKKNTKILKNKEEKLLEKNDEDTPTEDDLYLNEKFQYLHKINYLITKGTHLPGYPSWYKKLCDKTDSKPDWTPGPNLISTSMRITPKLLNLTWEGYPLHHLKTKGWGFLVPFSDDDDTTRSLPLKRLLEKCPLLVTKSNLKDSSDSVMTNISETVKDNLMRKEFYAKAKKDPTEGLYKGAGIFCNTIVEDCCWFFKLPHKNGVTCNVGNPLAKDFLNKFSENVLAGDTDSAEHILKIARMISYWKNNRDRIMDQMVVWMSSNLGAIVPQVVVSGTLTRRAMERTWMTASNAHEERIGSELRSMVQAPAGYYIVGADVDSQELWISSVIGDAFSGKSHGSTPFGWMTISGNKSDESDMHSVTAKAVGISRDHAKVINYARIYGAGQNFAQQLLKQFNPSISDKEAQSKALKMFTITKGKRIYYLKEDFHEYLADQVYSKWQANNVAKSFGKKLNEVFHEGLWVGGTESEMFNCLEKIANSPSPETPFLNSRLSRALEPSVLSDDKYLPTRINWVVQSGAVDFLHLMLVCMNWLMGDKIRFCLSFHDEVRYIVSEEYKYQSALAMHVTNLLTRSFCSKKLGLNDLPQSVAFFSSVEVDTVLRKDSKKDGVTPSNPHGLFKGYGVPEGESLDVREAIRKAGADKRTDWYCN